MFPRQAGAALLAACCLVLLAASPALAEIKSFTSTLRQPFSGSQSPDDARTAAITRAKRMALEQAGTYLESMTVVQNAALDKEEVLALTAGVSRVTVLREDKYIEGDQFGLEITAQVDVDTAVLDQRVQKLLADREHLAELQAALEREQALLAKVDQLEEQNRRLSAQVTGAAGEQHALRQRDLRDGFQEASQALTAVDHFRVGLALWRDGRFLEPENAVASLSRAIALDPNYAAAYNDRGIANGQLGRYQDAVEDFNAALRLDPGRTAAYLANRGNAWMMLEDYRAAEADLAESLRLDPDNSMTLVNQGLALYHLGRAGEALRSLDRAVALQPRLAQAYLGRGFVLDRQGDHQAALMDYSRALELDPNLAPAYFNRGVAAMNQGDLDAAVGDFSTYLVLEPEDVDARLLRGKSLAQLGNTGLMCVDFAEACRQGFCKNLNNSRARGLCR